MTGATVAALAHPGNTASPASRRARAHRLRSSQDVRAVFAARRAVSSPVAVVQVRRRGDAGPPRVAVVAGRKVGTAVERNRVKRRLRGLVPDLGLRDGVDYVLVGRRAALTAPAEQLRAALAQQVESAAGR